MTTIKTADRISLGDAPATPLEALLDPEALLRAWRDHGVRAYSPMIFAVLLGVTVAATFAYGLTMGIPLGWSTALQRGIALTLAAGAAWLVAWLLYASIEPDGASGPGARSEYALPSG